MQQARKENGQEVNTFSRSSHSSMSPTSAESVKESNPPNPPTIPLPDVTLFCPAPVIPLPKGNPAPTIPLPNISELKGLKCDKFVNDGRGFI